MTFIWPRIPNIIWGSGCLAIGLLLARTAPSIHPIQGGLIPVVAGLGAAIFLLASFAFFGFTRTVWADVAGREFLLTYSMWAIPFRRRCIPAASYSEVAMYRSATQIHRTTTYILQLRGQNVRLTIREYIRYGNARSAAAWISDHFQLPFVDAVRG